MLVSNFVFSHHRPNSAFTVDMLSSRIMKGFMTVLIEHLKPDLSFRIRNEVPVVLSVDKTRREDELEGLHTV